LCREEAQGLSSLRSSLDKAGVRLCAVVHEDLGTQVQDFRPFFQGPIYLDKERIFYGPRHRWMFLSGFVRLSVWQSLMRATSKGIENNLDGEGRLLGGVFVVGADEQGVLFEHRESEWGHHANLTEVMEAVKQIKPANKHD